MWAPTTLSLLLLLLLSTAAHATRIVTDELGRKVTLPDHPMRVICLAPSVTDTVYALGGGAQVIAISDYTQFPAEALKKPSVGDLIHPSVEMILSLHPDLVIGVATGGPTEAADKVAALHIPVFFTSPMGLTGILHSVSTIGDALNRPEDARSLVANLQLRIARVKAAANGRPTLTVFMPVSYDPLMSVGKHAFITELIEATGARSVTDDITADWPQVSMESILARAPQAIILNRRSTTTLDTLRTLPGWSSLSAVRNGHVLYVDARFELPSPVAIDALEDFSRQLHP